MKHSILRFSKIRLFTTLFILFCFSNTSAQLNFIPGVTATACSADGSIVVGDNGAQHFMWDETNGTTLIGGVPPQGYGGQTSINGAGTIIAGTRINPATSLGELSSYDIGTQTWTSHGEIGGSSGNSASSAWGSSADGTTIVGLGWINAGSAHAVRYVQGGVMEDLGSTVAGRSTRANKVSQDGAIVAGWQDSSTGFRQGAIWENGVQTLITHANGDRATEVGAMSADGVWYGGGQGFGNNFQAWLWSSATGIIDVGPAPTGGWRGAISGLSGDGNYATGFYRPFPAPATFGRGFYYTPGVGMEDLTDLAISLGYDVQGRILALPLGMSLDGTTIVGVTDNGNGFVLRIPLSPSNDTCAGAIPVDCGDLINASTVNATDSGGEPSPDVFYSYSSNGDLIGLTASLCNGGTNFDSYLRVFSDCTLTTEIASNNDFCGQQSEVFFLVEPGDTPFIMVEGAGTASGDFSMQISCEIIDIGTSEFAFKNLTYYPNPVNEALFIINTEAIQSVTLYSITGQKILEENPNAINVRINTSSLEEGVYFAAIIVDGHKKTIKIIK
ncbi:MAG: putative membrane protein [Flavobacteriales bacterium]|jgi:uncharacterized membrane protein